MHNGAILKICFPKICKFTSIIPYLSVCKVIIAPLSTMNMILYAGFFVTPSSCWRNYMGKLTYFNERLFCRCNGKDSSYLVTILGRLNTTIAFYLYSIIHTDPDMHFMERRFWDNGQLSWKELEKHLNCWTSFFKRGKKEKNWIKNRVKNSWKTTLTNSLIFIRTFLS